ncbi:hypothetical protein NCU16834 [Neurospora crassa OR74A]|uniref:Uncharacterized protein n=1 Tax=Neurospora crassa (strain ATCC 24698 / 74-OR23-1A / CBS 708.71 / DSM 1257 / FGSC 987) TaxID=367110 RepID=V5IMS3_NEUCR|nr:hypothetical protein NCU16834 [Neurospora crassa OR74A]ESA42992.1 hypothetical protein NCU16834 [Neurospora crassa OR74A]|eukprot:XP_011394419.1 hypothetical protein NCU16834 [Neurospora crassa OR74A]
MTANPILDPLHSKLRAISALSISTLPNHKTESLSSTSSSLSKIQQIFQGFLKTALRYTNPQESHASLLVQPV